MAEPMEVACRGSLDHLPDPHCTGAEQDSGTKRQHCVPDEMLQGAHGMAPESGPEARKDMPGHHSKMSLGKLFVLPSFPFFHCGTQMPPQTDPHGQS